MYTAYSHNVYKGVETTLSGVILGITHFGVEIHAQNSEIHSQKNASKAQTTTLEWFPHSYWSGFNSERSDPYYNSKNKSGFPLICINPLITIGM